jgi:hypothetical protein
MSRLSTNVPLNEEKPLKPQRPLNTWAATARTFRPSPRRAGSAIRKPSPAPCAFSAPAAGRPLIRRQGLPRKFASSSLTSPRSSG